MSFCYDPQNDLSLKGDQLAQWIEKEWIANRPTEDVVTVWPNEEIVHALALGKIPQDQTFLGYRFAGVREIECPVVTRIAEYNDHGDITFSMGAYVYEFDGPSGTVEAVVLGTHYADQEWYRIALAGVPRAFLPMWSAFEGEVVRLAYAMDPDEKVVVIGGRTRSFVPTTDWDEIVLPQGLKDDILGDVDGFFKKGVGVYKRLNLKPFRKLMLAGVPGTGKTMICSALAKWAISRDYLVIYVSSAHKNQNDDYGSNFGKIQHALSVAASSEVPTLIILEELDAYLHEEEKALILNTLDGSEAEINERGTLLIATTNYPEAIDERVLKRPGRLDRIFIVPETKREADAEQMLRKYLGPMWQDAHREVVPELVGSPGAFIREVAVHALTRVAYADGTELPLALLRTSLSGLKEQLAARDAFLAQREAAQTEAARAKDKEDAADKGEGDEEPPGKATLDKVKPVTNGNH